MLWLYPTKAVATKVLLSKLMANIRGSVQSRRRLMMVITGSSGRSLVDSVLAYYT